MNFKRFLKSVKQLRCLFSDYKRLFHLSVILKHTRFATNKTLDTPRLNDQGQGEYKLGIGNIKTYYFFLQNVR